MLLPLAVSALAPVVRPFARAALKSGILAYEKARETLEEWGESLDDIVAEVQQEMAEAREAVESAAEAGEEDPPGAPHG